ncbi:MAG: hypothetical protein R2684_04305 [Pyrinomonadaceae bacterium]
MTIFRKIIIAVSIAVFVVVGAVYLFTGFWDTSADERQTDGFVTKPHDIGREEAIAIASKFVSTNSDLDRVEAHATEFKDSWTANFVKKPEYGHWFGGNSSVEVMKKDGSIGRFYFEK